MNPPAPEWAEIEDLFFRALELPADERDAWIERQANGRTGLAAEVRSLLLAHTGSEQPAQPKRAGPYLLERLISRGGMGEVWLASRVDGSYRQQVALKLVRSGLGIDLLLPRFQQERQFLAQLNHPAIARLLDGGEAPDGRPYLVMEYVEGEPLLQFCDHRKLSLDERIRLFRKLCDAVEYAHRNLIVHRDIKPGNVLVTAEGQPKLLDFGIAKLTESREASAATAFPLVTPRYASPEQLRGESATTSTDVYSLGIVLFELLTGELPYRLKGESPAEIVTAITSQDARAPSKLLPASSAHVTRDLDAILAKALAKDAAARYPSVERFSADLGNYLDGLPVTARDGTRAYRFVKYVRRHWIGVTAAAVVALSLAGATVISVLAARTANRQRLRAQRVTHFLEEVLQSPDPTMIALGKGADTKISDVLASASAMIPEKFGDDPALEIELRQVVGRTYLDLGLYPQAEKEIQAALNRIDTAHDPAVHASIVEAAGELDYFGGRLVRAEKRFREALAILDAARLPPSIELAEMRSTGLGDLGTVLANQGKIREAAAPLQQAIATLKAEPLAPAWWLAQLENSLAFLDLERGDLAKCESDARSAVRHFSASPHPPVQLALALINLGMSERFLGRNQEAQSAFRDAMTTAARMGGDAHPFTRIAVVELAYQRALAGDFNGLEAQLARIVAGTKQPPGNDLLVRSEHVLGYVFTLEGHARQGEPLLRDALAVRSKVHKPTDYRVAQSEAELGECLARQGRLAEARELLQAAAGAYRDFFGPDVWITRDTVQKLRQASSK
jgi:serine/threonine-protein kinase